MSISVLSIIQATAIFLFFTAAAADLLKRNTVLHLSLIAGLIMQTILLLLRTRLAGVFTPLAAVEELYFLPWCLGMLALFSSRHADEHRLVTLPAAVFAALSWWAPSGVIPPSPKADSLFTVLFFFSEVAAHACFITAAWLAGRHLRRQSDFPSAHRTALWGFVLFSFSQITGAIWCYLGWAVPFMWSNRHMMTAAIWVFFADYLHLRYRSKRSTRTYAFFLMAGAVLVLLVVAWGQISEMKMLRIGG